MTQPGQLLGQHPGRLDRPAQRRHRITPRLRLHQRVQDHQHLRIQINRPGAPRTGPAHPFRATHTRLQLLGPSNDRVPAHTRHPGHRRLTTTADHRRSRSRQQPTLPLIKQRAHLREEPLQVLLPDLHPPTLHRATKTIADPNVFQPTAEEVLGRCNLTMSLTSRLQKRFNPQPRKSSAAACRPCSQPPSPPCFNPQPRKSSAAAFGAHGLRDPPEVSTHSRGSPRPLPFVTWTFVLFKIFRHQVRGCLRW